MYNIIYTLKNGPTIFVFFQITSYKLKETSFRNGLTINKWAGTTRSNWVRK